MMVLRRKEIVAAALVVLIGMAGYLNWHYQDTIQVRDGESFIEAGKRLGEAEYVTNTDVAAEESTDTLSKDDPATSQSPIISENEDYFEKAKLDRENSRSKSLEILNQTAANESFDKEIRKKAQEEILKASDNILHENSIENIAKAKGYDKICAFINEDGVSITVQKDQFSEKDVVKIQEIATEELKIVPNKVKVVEVK